MCKKVVKNVKYSFVQKQKDVVSRVVAYFSALTTKYQNHKDVGSKKIITCQSRVFEFWISTKNAFIQLKMFHIVGR